MTPTSRRKVARMLYAAVALVGLAAAPLTAQSTGTVRGTVVETGSRRPLAGAQVSIPGTNRGAVTNSAGEYALTNVAPGSVRLRATVIGYTAGEGTFEVTAGQTTRADFALGASAVALDAIVVTGTPGAVSKRTIGNSITTVDADAVMERTTTATLTELLQARSPGLQILPNSGVPGTAADIRVRGASSLIGNQPVVYVDGVRYNTDDLGSFTPSGAGATSFTGQRTSAFDFINPNDIESIEVIKGPAAATLYGAEAANGVIQIITKKGRRGEQRIQWNARFDQGINEWALPIPDNYTTCDAAKINERDTAGNPVWPGCQGVAAGSVITDNPLRRDPAALREGGMRRASLSMRGGGERYSFYVAGDYDENRGIFHNSYNERRSVRANFGLNPSDKVDIALNTSYARGDLRLPVGDEAAQGMLLSAFRGRPGRVTVNPLNAGWSTTRAEQANEYNNTTRSDRLTLGTTANLNPVQWFRNRLTLGFDYTASLAQVLSPAGSTDADFAGVREGFVAQRVPRTYVYSIDYAGNVERDLTGDLGSTTSFGMQANSRRSESLYAQGTGFGAPDVTLIGNAQSQSGSNSYSEAKSVGYFVQEQIAWRNRLFVTGAVRADDNSAFGENFDWIYYPKVSLSWILSEEPFFQRALELARVTDFKFRTAYGQAGRAPDPFAATQTYTVDKAVLSPTQIVSALRARSFGNPDLVAERGEEFEVGFDAAAFGDRLGLEFTYYDKTMRDVIISTGAVGSTGFGNTFYGTTTSVLKNLGETHNSGVELGLTATPVASRRFAWDTRITVTTNDNELVSFGDTRTREAVSGQAFATVQEHRAGYPLAGYWAQLARRNPDGTPVLNAAGTVQLDTATYIGPSAPTREVSFSNTFTFLRDFGVYVLFDYKGGHYIYNHKEFNRCGTATVANCERINNPANASNPELPVWRQVRAAYIEKADFVKLRDLSLTYTVPPAWSQRFRASTASLTLAGHNLALWSDYSGIDPEVNGYGSGGITGGGISRSFARADVFPVPMTRRVSVSLNLSF